MNKSLELWGSWIKSSSDNEGVKSSLSSMADDSFFELKNYAKSSGFFTKNILYDEGFHKAKSALSRSSSDYKLDESASIKEAFEKEFDFALQVSSFEYGHKSYADEVVEKYYKKNEDDVSTWLQDYFLSVYSNSQKVIGILRVLQHMDYSVVHVEGSMIALSVLSHKNSEVVENGVRCFENWERPETLPILESVRVREAWLQEYVDQVISDLREV